MTHPRNLSLSELARAYQQKKLSPVEVTKSYLDQLEPSDVYRIITPERALQQAKQAEKRFMQGISLGPLQGIPLALKDLLDTKGNVTAAGSKVLAEQAPASVDSPVAARLDAAGAVFLGKTNMTELAFSGLGLNPHFGTPGNALNETRIPGGSSSGSGVAVSKQLACAAIGSDTGGSVRIPASFNGIIGLKTSNGAIPKDKVVPLSTTLDTLGPMTRTVEDAWHLWRVLAAKPVRPFNPKLAKRLRFLVPQTIVFDNADQEVAEGFTKACQYLEALGHELVYSPVPEFNAILELYTNYGSFASHESLALYEDLLMARGHDIDPRVAKRILEFRGRPSTDYLKLIYAQQSLLETFWETYCKYTAILSPTVAILPPSIQELEKNTKRYFETNGLCLRNTMLFNFLAGPAVSVPCYKTSEGLSVGLMIATSPHTESLALGIASLIEENI